MSWATFATSGENGSAALRTDADGTNQYLRQNVSKDVKYAETLYFRITVYATSAFNGPLVIGAYLKNASGADLSFRQFLIANVDIPKNTWTTLRGQFTANVVGTALAQPAFGVNTSGTTGQVTVSDFDMSTTFPGSVEFVNGTSAATVESNAQTGYDLTQDNGTVAHPSSITINAVTQHEGGINALNLLGGPAEVGATNGATMGANLKNEAGTVQSDNDALNLYTSYGNMFVDPSFVDASTRNWFTSGGWSRVDLGSGQSVMRGTANGTNRDLYTLRYMQAGNDMRLSMGARVYDNYSGIEGLQFLCHCYDKDYTYITTLVSDELYSPAISWQAVYGQINLRFGGNVHWILPGIRLKSSVASGTADVDWLYASFSGVNGIDIAPGRIVLPTNQDVDDLIVWTADDWGAPLAKFGLDYLATISDTAWVFDAGAPVVALGHFYADYFYSYSDSSFYVRPNNQSRMSSILTSAVTDLDNSAYYSNPGGTSLFNDLRANIFYDRNNTGYYWHGDSTSVGYHVQATNQMRSPIYYDRNNTGYYFHGDSVSHALDMRVGILYDRNNTGYYWHGDSTSYSNRNDSNDCRANIFYDRLDTVHYVEPGAYSIFNHIGTDRHSTGLYTNIAPSVEVRSQQSGAAGMAFHRPGSQAIMFGLDTDNICKLGGWSWGDIFSWRGTGQFTAAGVGVHADAFYDRNDTSVYYEANRCYLRGGDPTVMMRDTNGRSAFFHVNSNRIYILGSTSNDAATWGTVGGEYPARWDIATNYVRLGGACDVVGTLNSGVSDRRLKTNRKILSDASSRLRKMRGYTFTWKEKESIFFGAKDYRYDFTEVEVGCMAQEVELGLPEAVSLAPFDTETDPLTGRTWSKSSLDFKTVKYEMLTPLLLEGWHEHDKKIASLEEQINNLTELVNQLLESK